jgi:hypothetical protein
MVLIYNRRLWTGDALSGYYPAIRGLFLGNRPLWFMNGNYMNETEAEPRSKNTASKDQVLMLPA